MFQYKTSHVKLHVTSPCTDNIESHSRVSHCVEFHERIEALEVDQRRAVAPPAYVAVHAMTRPLTVDSSMEALLALSYLLASSHYVTAGSAARDIPAACVRYSVTAVRCQVPGPPDAMLPHPDHCELFYYCEPSGATCRQCPAGLHFNPRLRVCDWPAIAGCTAHAASITSTNTPVEETTTYTSHSTSTPVETTTYTSHSTGTPVEETTAYTSHSTSTPVEETTTYTSHSTSTPVEETTTYTSHSASTPVEETTTYTSHSTGTPVEETTTYSSVPSESVVVGNNLPDSTGHAWRSITTEPEKAVTDGSRRTTIGWRRLN